MQKRYKEKGKRAFVISILSRIYNLFRSKKTTHVVLDALSPFHFEHIKGVIPEFQKHPEFEVSIVAPKSCHSSLIPEVRYFESILEIPLYNKVDIFITTEMGRIEFWLESKNIYFGHGMGPKFKYLSNRKFLEFDYFFSPALPTYEVQQNTLEENKIFKVGMPILDNVSMRLNKLKRLFSIDNDFPIILYAPSWSNKFSTVSDITAIIHKLKQLQGFNLIISPHPLLFKPERCDGKDIFNEGLISSGLIINNPSSGITTLEIVAVAEFIVSDISSVLFEAMALGKKIIFDENKALYEYDQACHIYEQVLAVSYLLFAPNFSTKTLNEWIKEDPKKSLREAFINNYLFNRGNASKAFIAAIKAIKNIK